MCSWSISWIFWGVWSDGVSEVCRFNLPYFPSSLPLVLIGAALPVSKQQGAVLNEVSLPVVTFCPLRLTADCCCSLVWIKMRRGRGFGLLHCTTQQCIKEEGWEEAGGFEAVSLCFTSKLCLDKPRSTCIITTGSVTFSRHEFRLCFNH